MHFFTAGARCVFFQLGLNGVKGGFYDVLCQGAHVFGNPGGGSMAPAILLHFFRNL